MTNEVIIRTIGAIISGLLLIIGYFMAAHIRKTDNLSNKVSSIETTLAAVKTQVKFNSNQFLNLEASIRRQIQNFAENSSGSISTAIMVGKEDKRDTKESIQALNQEVAKLHIRLGILAEMQTSIKSHGEQLGTVFRIITNHNDSIKNINKKLG